MSPQLCYPPSTTGFVLSEKTNRQQPRPHRNDYTHPQSGLAVPRHRLHHALQADIVANQVLVTRKDQNWNAFQNARQEGDGSIRVFSGEITVDFAAALFPLC